MQVRRDQLERVLGGENTVNERGAKKNEKADLGKIEHERETGEM